MYPWFHPAKRFLLTNSCQIAAFSRAKCKHKPLLDSGGRPRTLQIAFRPVFRCGKFAVNLCAGGHETLSAGWAGPRKWKIIGPQCSEFVRKQLEPLVKQIRATKAQLDRLTEEIEALVAEEKIPVALGALTVSLIDGEVCNWTRFVHRKAVGSYTGCCPSEHSSSGVQRFGAIDRHGKQACPGAAGRSSVAAVTLAAQLACPPEILRETQSWRFTQKENGGGTGSTVGRRPVALENRPGDCC
jgi:hypothetical protein